MNYSEEDLNAYLNEALLINAIQPIYKAAVKNGVLSYLTCVPHVHWLTHMESGLRYECVSADESVIVGRRDLDDEIKIIYAADIGDYNIYTPSFSASGAEPIYTDELPPIGMTYTHENGNVYLVYGYGNLKANEKNRDKYPVNIHYVGTNGNTWDKSLENFKEKMVPGGVFQFNEGISFVYMGVTENEVLANGFMTREIETLTKAAQREA